MHFTSLVTISSMVVPILIPVMVIILILRAAHSQRLLNGHFLSAKLHGVHQVIHDRHGPHWRRIPGLHVAVLPNQEHWEVLRTDLEVVPDILNQRGREVLPFNCSASCGGQTEEGLEASSSGSFNWFNWVFIVLFIHEKQSDSKHNWNYKRAYEER